MGKGALLFVAVVAACAALGCGEDDEPTVPAECATAGPCAVFTAGQAIRIGLSGPMSDDVAIYGEDVLRGIEIALADADPIHGRAFEVDAQDDLGSAEGATAVANAFVADPTVVAVVGPMFSGAAEAAMTVYEAARIPMVSPSATRISLTQQGSSVFNRVVGSDLFQADMAAEMLYTDLAARDLAIIHDESSYGEALAERVEAVFVDLGGDVVAFEDLTSGDDDYGDVLDAVAAESPDAIFFAGYVSEAVVLCDQRADSGLGDIPFMTDDGVLGSTFITEAGDAAEGVCATAQSVPPDSAAKDAFDAAYLEAYGVAAGSITTTCWAGHDAVSMIIAAIEDVAIQQGDRLYVPRQALVARVRATSGFEGISGDITCDATGECMQGGFAVFRVEDGEWVPVE